MQGLIERDRIVIQLPVEEKKRAYHARVEMRARSWREMLNLLVELYEACRQAYLEDDPRKIVERLRGSYTLLK